MRVLVTGGSGQLGLALPAALAGHEVIAPPSGVFDLGDRDSVLSCITTASPDCIVHAGAYTDVDGCELDPERAFRVNALGTRHVAHGARIAGARVCYVSTDYVFRGDAGRPYDEWDQPDPLSVYGRSKLGGERELDPGSTVVRTSWVCSRHGRNFVKTIVRAAAGAGPDGLRVVDDQHGCPTFADDLAAAVARLVVARQPGVFHVTNSGATTWFHFAQAIVAAAGLDPEIVHPIPTSALDPPRPAPRPAWSVLDNAALRLSGLPLLPDWQESLQPVVKGILEDLTAPSAEAEAEDEANSQP